MSTLPHRIRLATVSAVAGATLLTALAPGVALAHQKNGPNDIHVCHRTGSDTNPYVLLHLPPSAVDGERGGGDGNGHGDHRGVHTTEPLKGRIDYIEGYNAPASVFKNFTKDSECEDYHQSQNPNNQIPVVPAAVLYPMLGAAGAGAAFGIRRLTRRTAR